MMRLVPGMTLLTVVFLVGCGKNAAELDRLRAEEEANRLLSHARSKK
jgi:hypothetical protein